MKIIFYWIGKTKEKFVKEGLSKYMKLLRPYCRIEIIELKEGKGIASVDMVKEKEGHQILKKAKDYILLDEKGHEFSSEEFANYVKRISENPMKIVIGGAFGTSKEVKQNAKFILSLAKLTYTHEITRLILFEQLYRAFTIIHHKTYHC